MRNVMVAYTGGQGGHYIWHYLQASGKFDQPYDIKENFYKQFAGSKPWLKHEKWPTNDLSKKENQCFHYCIPPYDKPQYLEAFDTRLDCYRICPTMNYRDWLRTIIAKKTSNFRHTGTALSVVKKNIKQLKNNPPILKVPRCDYYFDILQFVHKLSEREKLCKFVGVDINDTMEQFNTHYVELHKNLVKTGWVIKKN